MTCQQGELCATHVSIQQSNSRVASAADHINDHIHLTSLKLETKSNHNKLISYHLAEIQKVDRATPPDNFCVVLWSRALLYAYIVSGSSHSENSQAAQVAKVCQGDLVFRFMIRVCQYVSASKIVYMSSGCDVRNDG